ncbi:MAG: radical SAM protein [Chloroflexi bacterium]|nr:radical SAM protein [Chloroflexota bacterium]
MLGVTRLLGGVQTETDHLRYGPGQGEAWHRPVVVWTVTRKCNLACIHCYAAAGNQDFPGELSHEEGRALLKDLADFGVPVVLFSGGEPLIRPDILELATYARELGLRITFSTNGTLVTPEIAGRLKRLGVGYVGISLDGIDETHDYFRGVKGAFEAALAGIRHCQAAGLRVGVRLTLTRHTVRDLDNLFELLQREHIDRVCFYHLVPSGRGRTLIADLLDPVEARAAVENIFRRAADYVERGVPIELLTVDNHTDAAFLYLWLQRERGQAEADRVRAILAGSGGNRSGIAIGHVDNRGNIHPDQFWWKCVLGNVRKRPFSEVWSDLSNPVLAGLRDRRPLLKGRCAECRFLDICNGNFRSRAATLTGDPWAPDPSCYLTDEEIGVQQEVLSHA